MIIQLRKNAVIIPVGIAIASIFLLRKQLGKTLLICLSSVLVGVVLSSGIILVSNADESPSREAFAVPSFQIAYTYYCGGEIPEDARKVFEEERSSEEWASAYVSSLEGNDIYSADLAKSTVEVSPEFVRAWLETGVSNPVLYLKAWVKLEYPFWVACSDNSLMKLDFIEHQLFIDNAANTVENGSGNADSPYILQLRQEKSRAWHSPASLYDELLSTHIPILSDLVILLLFNRALPFYVMLVCLVAAFIKKNKLPVLIAVPSFCIWLSLILFAPVALMRYAMEMYYALPILLIVCARCRNYRSVDIEADKENNSVIESRRGLHAREEKSREPLMMNGSQR